MELILKTNERAGHLRFIETKLAVARVTRNNGHAVAGSRRDDMHYFTFEVAGVCNDDRLRLQLLQAVGHLASLRLRLGHDSFATLLSEKSAKNNKQILRQICATCTYVVRTANGGGTTVVLS